jgi:hypothetical protein
MKNLAQQHAFIELSRGANDFIAIAKYLGGARGDTLLASRMAAAAGASERVVEAVRSVGQKAAVGAGTTTDSVWAQPLALYSQASGAFVESLRNGPSVFDMMLPNMRRAPLHTQFSLTTVGAVGETIVEGGARTISSLSLESHNLAEHKAMAAVIVSSELLRIGGNDASAMLNLEVRQGLAAVCNQSFLGLVTTGLTPIASSGSTMVAARTDMMAALNAVRLSESSKVFVIAEPGTMKTLALNITESGPPSFGDNLGILGGTAAGMTFLVSDSLTAGQMVFVDANQLVGNAGDVELSTIRQGSIQMVDTSPDSPPTQNTILHNLWQSGHVCISASRFYGCERVRSTAAAVISGCHYLGDSP